MMMLPRSQPPNATINSPCYAVAALAGACTPTEANPNGTVQYLAMASLESRRVVGARKARRRTMDNTLISKLKQAARALKREAGLTHTEALDQIAQHEGSRDWAHLMCQSPAAQLAPVTLLPIPKSRTEIFHHVEIEGMDFTALVSVDWGLFINGPKDSAACGYQGQVNLGVCGVVNFEDGSRWNHRVSSGSWWICKYQDEARIDVTRLTDAGRRALANEFGFAFGDDEDADDFGRRFKKSPAFDALVAWVQSHPRLAKQANEYRDPYVPHWYERVMEKLHG